MEVYNGGGSGDNSRSDSDQSSSGSCSSSRSGSVNGGGGGSEYVLVRRDFITNFLNLQNLAQQSDFRLSLLNTRGGPNSPTGGPHTTNYQNDIKNSQDGRKNRRVKSCDDVDDSCSSLRKCHVCGDKAPNHIHYGGIACFSCRAFFRRSVAKHHAYTCAAACAGSLSPQMCVMTPQTRKNCQACRYNRCVAAGMKASWVMSEEERMSRATTLSSRGAADSNISNKRKEGVLASQPAVFSESEVNEITRLLDLYRATGMYGAMPDSVLREIDCLLLDEGHPGNKIQGDVLVEMYRELYGRAAAFVNGVEEFRWLSELDKRSLLSKNLDMVCNVRMALRLDPDTGMITIRGYGHDSRVISLRLERLFAAPWAKSTEHETLFRKTITIIATLVKQDIACSMLYQMVALFHSYGLQLSESGRRSVEALQTKYATMLHSQLRARLGDARARTAIARFMFCLTDLRTLSDWLLDGEDSHSM